MDKHKNQNNNDSTKIAGKFYRPSDYHNNSELSSGLATTHEQVSDTLTEGTIDEEKEQEKKTNNDKSS